MLVIILTFSLVLGGCAKPAPVEAPKETPGETPKAMPETGPELEPLNQMLTNIQYLLYSDMSATTSSALVTQLPATTARMAIAVLGVIPIFVAFPFFQKYLVKGITIGAVKG